MTTKNLLFSPDETGWCVNVIDDGLTVTAVRKSPWCDQGHLEGLSDKIMEKIADVPSVERRGAYLKQEVEAASAGWGCCKTCHPNAEYDHERASARIKQLRAEAS